MDRAFMEEYYDLKYRDGFMPNVLELNEHCKELQNTIMALEGQTEAIMRKEGEECLLLHGKLFAAKGELDALVMRLAYLQGAEDREKMLR